MPLQFKRRLKVIPVAIIIGKDLKRVFDFMLGEYHNIYKDNSPKESNCKVTGIR